MVLPVGEVPLPPGPLSGEGLCRALCALQEGAQNAGVVLTAWSAVYRLRGRSAWRTGGVVLEGDLAVSRSGLGERGGRRRLESRLACVRPRWVQLVRANVFQH